MAVSEYAYLGLLALAALGRFAELRYSARNQRRMAAQGAQRIAESHFRWMVALHAGVFVGAGLEVVLLKRPLIPPLAAVMGALFLGANLLRWWVMAAMAEHWNVQVMDSARLGVVTRGPFRWVRHPNYLAVFVELVSLPLIYTAWITAALAAVGNVWILSRRLAVEEEVLRRDPVYRSAMLAKPRFLPRLF
jgi:methyltransferase